MADSGNINGGTRKVILFLGSNIGNFSEPEVDLFLTRLSDFCRKGDKILIGFDLKKSPDIIMKAYEDPEGLTREFNLNHLARLNREIDADFNLNCLRQVVLGFVSFVYTIPSIAMFGLVGRSALLS